MTLPEKTNITEKFTIEGFSPLEINRGSTRGRNVTIIKDTIDFFKNLIEKIKNHEFSRKKFKGDVKIIVENGLVAQLPSQDKGMIELLKR